MALATEAAVLLVVVGIGGVFDGLGSVLFDELFNGLVGTQDDTSSSRSRQISGLLKPILIW